VDDRHGQNPWSELEPKIAWRGSLTGIFAQDEADTMASQRYRLGDMMASNYSQVPVLISTNDTAGLELVSLRSGPLNDRWMNVGVLEEKEEVYVSHTKEVAMTKFLSLGWMSYHSPSVHKIMLDVDGWGWSARFRELLWSGSYVTGRL
jgi:beta-1,2-xylosyltransferase